MSIALRETFTVATRTAIQWFPGHMGKGLRQMQQKLKTVDCIIEVHDARIPISGRNQDFKHTISGIKPHILVLNKKDLANTSNYKNIAENIKDTEAINEVLYTNCKDQQCYGIRKIVPLAVDLIRNSNRYNRTEEKDFCVMIIGVPNVGKSSLINVLRNRHLKQKKASAVGAIAGITRSVMNKIKISDNPLIYMVDTPGILEPKVKDDEMGMKLALCGCLQDHLVGEDLIADFLLYWLNKQEKYEYVELMGLNNGPTDVIQEVLISGARKLDRIKKYKNYDGRLIARPDTTYAAQFFLKAFRSGYFGQINLDQNLFR